MIWPDNAKYEG